MNEDFIKNYVSKITAEFKTGQAREHAYRPALKELFESVVPNLQAINDPKRSEHGAPDFALMRSKELSAGYAEAKDVTVPLDETEKSEQMERYLEYGSVILTNSLEFRFFRHHERYGEPIVVARIENGQIIPNERAYADLEDTLRTFLTETEPITSSSKLAKIMGDKARRIRDKVAEYVISENERNEELRRMYESFKKILIHDLKEEQFADMYAQTLVYGLFAARYEDKTPENFSRQEARDLIPHSNPFLRSFFDHITGANFDIRLAIIVNELCEVFKYSDVHVLMNAYVTQKGLSSFDDKESADPVIHFYEDFLKEYDAEKRKSLGAFYTPLPVVRFIIRATDYLLEKEFGLTNGLSDTTKIEIKTTKQGVTKKEPIHKVQILDPATGTGTFLNEIIKNILVKFKGQEGRWKSYVEEDLLPRLHGFELMMAPYTIAHIKLAMTLHDSGITDFRKRLGVYLTNSLEEGVKIEESLFGGFGFGQSITDESKAAAKIKNETPIMVVIGNPPYSGESSNAHYNGNDVYKIEPSGGKLQERNSKWLNDDYVKFIRFAESMIEKTGEGIVSMITAHGYIDNPTFRGMRWHLMQTFDEIYVLDLHGNANKKETATDGSKDENVFAIKTGVAILIGVKRKEKSVNKLAKVFRADSFGSRKMKFEYLKNNDFKVMDWVEVASSAPNYEWVARDTKKFGEYKKGFSVADLFPVSSVGIVTSRDNFVIDFEKEALKKRMLDFLATENPKEALQKFELKENLKWKVTNALKHTFEENSIVPISYRPFDDRFIYYEEDFIERSRKEIMRNCLSENTCLVARRQMPEDRTTYFFISDHIMADGYIRSDNKGSESIFPLYLYADDGSKIPNLKQEIILEIEKVVGKITPEDVLDYIYAVLHSPSYREKYKEFLKIDFPRVPYPKDKKQFVLLIAPGKELRELHLLESPKLKNTITTFSQPGSDIVETKYPKYENGKVFINETQYFGDVPEIAWNFYIGGYQPAQKWLKDRRGRKLSNDDLTHYQKMIVALVETDRIMKEIDEVFKLTD